VLPDINADEGNQGQERVLVGGGGDLDAVGLGVNTEPAPAGTLNTQSSGGELSLEILKTAEGLNDGLLKRAIGEDTTVALTLGIGGCEILPEEGVVDVTTAIELQGSLESDPLFGSGGLGVGLLSGIQSVNIRLMVLRVVKLHDLTADVGLESIVGVREVGESVVGHRDER